MRLRQLEACMPKSYPHLLQLAADKQVRKVEVGEGPLGKRLRERLRIRKEDGDRVTFGESLWIAVAAAVDNRVIRQNYRIEQAKMVGEALPAEQTHFYFAICTWEFFQAADQPECTFIYGTNEKQVEEAVAKLAKDGMGTGFPDEIEPNIDPMDKDHANMRSAGIYRHTEAPFSAPLGYEALEYKLLRLPLSALDRHVAINVTKDPNRRLFADDNLRRVCESLSRGSTHNLRVWDEDDY